MTDGRLIVRAKATESGVVVEVEDNGPGVPEEIQSRIFDSFFTTKPPGSGTGLYVGNLTVDSRPGRTVFRVELPLRLPGRPSEPDDEAVS